MSIKEKLNVLRENNDLVTVKGFGKMTRTQLQAKIQRELSEAMRAVKEGNYKNAYNYLYYTGVMRVMFEAELEEEKNDEAEEK